MMKLGCMSLSYKQEFTEGRLDLEGFIERAYQLGEAGNGVEQSGAQRRLAGGELLAEEIGSHWHR